MDVRTGLAEHLRSGQVSRVVYGSIIGLALVLTLERHPPGIGTAIGTLIATALAVGLAELYSELVGGRARAGMGGEREPMEEVLADTVAVAFGIAFPSVFLVGAAIGLFEYDTAFTIAKWTGLGLIAGYGYVASRLSGETVWGALKDAAVVALIAAALIGFKALLH